MKYFLLLLVFLSLCPTISVARSHHNNAYIILPPDSLNYPLEIGDTWFYEDTQYESHGTKYTSQKIRKVIGDTSINGVNYKILMEKRLGAYDYILLHQRVDSLSKRVYSRQYQDGTTIPHELGIDEVLVADFKLIPGESLSYPSLISCDSYDIFTFNNNIYNSTVFSCYEQYYSLRIEYCSFGLCKYSFRYMYDNTRTVIGCIINGISSGVISAMHDNYTIPYYHNLEQNYPNPFNPSTTISYQIPSSSFVTLKLYDVLGNEVAVLVNEWKEAGSYNAQFTTGSAVGGKQLASGMYFYTLTAGKFTDTKKFILLK